jgi:hypothetical protein
MELRMREKEPLIAAGEWAHWRQVPLPELQSAVERNAAELIALSRRSGLVSAQELEQKAADLANRAWMLAFRREEKQAEGRAGRPGTDAPDE